MADDTDATELATDVLRRCFDAWTALDLPAFDLASAMMVHGASYLRGHMGPARFRGAVDQMRQDLEACAIRDEERTQ